MTLFLLLKPRVDHGLEQRYERQYAQRVDQGHLVRLDGVRAENAVHPSMAT